MTEDPFINRDNAASREDESEHHQRALSADEAVRPARGYRSTGFVQPHTSISVQSSMMYLPLVSDDFDAKLAARHKRPRPKSLDLTTRFNMMNQTDSDSAGVDEIQPKETSLASVPDSFMSDEGEAVEKRLNVRRTTSSGRTEDSKLKVMSDNEGERMVGHSVHKTKTVMSHDYIRRRETTL